MLHNQQKQRLELFQKPFLSSLESLLFSGLSRGVCSCQHISRDRPRKKQKVPKPISRSISIWVVLQIRIPFKLPFIRVPHYIGDLKRDPNLENYPYPRDSFKTSKTNTDLEIFQKPFSKNSPKNKHKATRNGFESLPFCFLGLSRGICLCFGLCVLVCFWTVSRNSSFLG